MTAMSATDLAIRSARRRGTLEITEREGRFGTFWAIRDEHGTITVASSRAEARNIMEGRYAPAEVLA